MHCLLAVAMMFRLVERPWWHLARRPSELFQPVWVISWIPGQPGALLIGLVQVLGVMGAIAVILRRAPRIGFAITWLSLVFVAACWGSSGKVMHNEVMLITVAVPMLFTELPGRVEPASWSAAWGWAPRASAAVLGTIYLATGVQKLRHSGLNWVFSDNMTWVVRQGRSPFGHQLNLDLARHQWLMVSLAFGALLFELTAPLLLYFRRTRLIVPLVSFIMHMSIWALLGLNYSPWILTSAAVAVPLAMHWNRQRWYQRLDWPWALAAGDTGQDHDPVPTVAPTTRGANP